MMLNDQRRTSRRPAPSVSAWAKFVFRSGFGVDYRNSLPQSAVSFAGIKLAHESFDGSLKMQRIELNFSPGTSMDAERNITLPDNLFHPVLHNKAGRRYVDAR